MAHRLINESIQRNVLVLFFPDLLVDMLGALAAYSITVQELQQLFGHLRARNGVWVSKESRSL